MSSVEEAILTALSRARPAYVAVEALSAAVAVDFPDLSPRGLQRAVKALAKDGLVTNWPGAPSGPAWILSELAAERMGLELQQDEGWSQSQSLRWAPIDSRRVRGRAGR